MTIKVYNGKNKHVIYEV